jgi:hypothetical protein
LTTIRISWSGGDTQLASELMNAVMRIEEKYDYKYKIHDYD